MLTLRRKLRTLLDLKTKYCFHQLKKPVNEAISMPNTKELMMRAMFPDGTTFPSISEVKYG